MAVTKYSEKLLIQASELAAKGCTDKEIYNTLDLGHETFYRYRKKYPEFKESIEKNRKASIVDAEATYKRLAMGYQDIKITREYKIDDEGEKKLIREREEIINLPPNYKALERLLFIADPDKWREKSEVDLNVTYKVIPAPEIEEKGE